MMDENIYNWINHLYFDLTKSEKKIADYVLQHRDETQYMSISEVADEVSVAEATLTRFCRKLGLKGFNQFKLALAKASNGVGGVDGNAEIQLETASLDEHLNRTIEFLTEKNIQALQQTRQGMNPEALLDAADSIRRARHVYCMGQGGSMVLAYEAYSLFLTVSPKFSIAADNHLQAMTASLLNEEDVILYFSYSGATRDLLELQALCEKSGCKMILVTRFPNSPGARKADVVLRCGSDETPLRSGSVQARVSQLLVLDILYEIYITQDIREARSALELSVDAISTKLL